MLGLRNHATVLRLQSEVGSKALVSHASTPTQTHLVSSGHSKGINHRPKASDDASSPVQVKRTIRKKRFFHDQPPKPSSLKQTVTDKQQGRHQNMNQNLNQRNSTEHKAQLSDELKKKKARIQHILREKQKQMIQPIFNQTKDTKTMSQHRQAFREDFDEDPTDF